MNKWIIEVTPIFEFDELDHRDVDDSGACLVDGAYRLHVGGELAEGQDPKDAALDLFHALVPISMLEDYDVIIREETPADAGDGWLRRDLGRHDTMPESPGPDF